MLNLKLPDQYDTGMSIRETEVAIKLIKDFFERELSEALALTRVSAPLFVSPDSERQFERYRAPCYLWNQGTG